MKCQKSLAGFTIIEVMIFLAVSGGLLISAIATISGQQGRTQFTTGVREFESRIQDLINDVETGYFPSNLQLECRIGGDSGPDFDIDATVSQGTNQECVFLGKALQFYKNNEGLIASYRTVNIAGIRQATNPLTGKKEEPDSLEAFKPRAVYKLNAPVALENFEIPFGIAVTKIRYITGFNPLNSNSDYEGLAIVPSYTLQNTNNIVSNLGNGRSSIAALDGDPGFNDYYNIEPTGLPASIKTLSNASIAAASKGTVICLSDGGGRKAAVAIGVQLAEGAGGVFEAQSTNQRLATEVFVDDQAATLGCTDA